MLLGFRNPLVATSEIKARQPKMIPEVIIKNMPNNRTAFDVVLRNEATI